MIRFRSWIWLLSLFTIAAIAAERTTQAAGSEADDSVLMTDDWSLTLLDDRSGARPGFTGWGNGFLGIGLVANSSPARVQQVVIGSGADKAGVRVNDKIIALGKLENPDAIAVMDFVRKHDP